MLTRYAIVDESGTQVCTLDVRDGCVDTAPDLIAYVRTLPMYEAVGVLAARRLHAVVEEIWLSQTE